MLKIFRAKIINCSSPDYWYKDIVGEQVYCLERCIEESPFIYEMILTDVRIWYNIQSKEYFINKEDLLVLEEFDGDLIKYTYFKIVRKNNETTQS